MMLRDHMAFRENGGGGQSPLSEYREGGMRDGIIRIVQSLIGGSGKFYHDKHKIFLPPRQKIATGPFCGSNCKKTP